MIDHKCSVCAGVPTIWEGVKVVLESNPSLKARISPNWNRLHVGGSAMSRSLTEYYFKNFNVEPHHGFGMTETNPFVSMSTRSQKRKYLTDSDDERFARVEKQGMLMPGLKWKIVDPEARCGGQISRRLVKNRG